MTTMLKCEMSSRRTVSLRSKPGNALHKMRTFSGRSAGLAVRAITTLLEHPEQHALTAGGDVAELLDEQDSAVGAFERAGLLAVAEELPLRFLRAQVAAHQDDERRARVSALASEIAREQLAAAARFAREQRMCVVLRDSRDLLAQRAHRLALARRRRRLRDCEPALVLRAAHRERFLDGAQQLR